MNEIFSKFARTVSAVAGHPFAFVFALLGVTVWAGLGPSVHYSEVWQLWINSTTNILTFLMIFLLQNAQNRDSRAIQLKLNELLRADKRARGELIGLEHLSDQQLAKYHREFQELCLRYAKINETNSSATD